MSKEEFLKIQTCVLKVNIHCDGCKHKVKKILQKIEGVYKIGIDSESGKVTVSGNVDPATLIKKLTKHGKHAELWGAPKGNNNQNQLNNQMKNMQIENGKGGNNNKGQGQKGNNNQGQGQQGKGGNPVMPNPQQLQQLQHLKALQDMKLPPQFKDLKIPMMNGMPGVGKVPVPNPKAGKQNLPPEDDLSDYEYDDELDDEFDDDDFDDEMDEMPLPPQNKMKPIMVGGAHMPNMMNVGNGGNGGGGAGGGGGGNGKKAGGGGAGNVPVQLNGGGGGGGGKKGGGGGGNNGGGGNQNPGGGSAQKGGKNGGGKPQDGGKNNGGGGGQNKGAGGGGGGGGGNHNANGNGGKKGGGGMNDGLPGMPKMMPMNAGVGPMGSMPMSQMGHQMGPMGNLSMGQMGQLPAVQGLPATAMNGGGGYFQGAGPDLPAGNPYHQQQLAAMMMNQQRANGNERFQPMMYARPPPAVNYMPPYPYYPYPPPPPSDNYSTFFSDENTSSCSVM